MNVPPVSIVIPTLNEEHYLPILLKSLAGTGEPMEIIVVDGNSTDGTAGVVSQFRSRFTGESSLRLIAAPERGISKQRNLGARHASHPLVLFLDADVRIPSRHAYRAILHQFVQGNYDAVSACLHPDGHDIRGSIIFLIGRVFQRVMLFFGEAYFAGSLVLCNKEFFFKLGGFDETKRVAEDIDFSIRASHAGRVAMVPVYIPVSTRRFKKYGYWHVFVQWFVGISRVVIGVGEPKKGYTYPFGEHGRQ
jgi:glycosyltransferase involved in cell wall biosynthesis